MRRVEKSRILVSFTLDKFLVEELEQFCKKFDLKNKSLFAEICLSLGLALLEQRLEEGGVELEAS